MSGAGDRHDRLAMDARGARPTAMRTIQAPAVAGTGSQRSVARRVQPAMTAPGTSVFIGPTLSTSYVAVTALRARTTHGEVADAVRERYRAPATSERPKGRSARRDQRRDRRDPHQHPLSATFDDPSSHRGLPAHDAPFPLTVNRASTASATSTPVSLLLAAPPSAV
jgi:hypothetical protein